MSEYPCRGITFYALLHWSPVYAMSSISMSLTPLYRAYNHAWFINQPFIFSLFISQWPNNSLPATGLVPRLLRLSWMRWSASAPYLRKLKSNGEFPKQKSSDPKAGRGGGLCWPYRPWLQTAKVKVLSRCAFQLPTSSARYWSQLSFQSMKLPGLLWSIFTRRTNCITVPGFLSLKPAHRVCKWPEHRTWWCLDSKVEISWISSFQTARPS